MVTDFQKNGACEWLIGTQYKLPNYLASAALPLDGIRAMIERRKTQQPGAERTAVILTSVKTLHQLASQLD